MPSLIGKTLINRALPSKSEILKSAGRSIKSFLKNPIAATKAGLARDRNAVNTYRNLTGKTRKQVAGNLAKLIGKGVYKGGGKDLLVNTGGFAGSKIGASGGIAGSLAGDWAGAAGTRKVLDDVEATSKALRIRKNPAFQRQSPATKAKIIAKRARGYAKANTSGYKKELKADTVGWGIGNTAAETLNKVPGISGIPLKGAAVAMPSVKPVMKGAAVANRVARTPSVSKLRAARLGVTSVTRGIRRSINPISKIKSGLAREKKMYNSVNSQLQKLPKLPQGTNFRRNYFFLSEFSKNNTLTIR